MPSISQLLVFTLFIGLLSCTVNQKLGYSVPPPSCSSIDFENTTSNFHHDYSKLPRGVSKRVFPRNLDQTGSVIMNVCIDRDGKVICVDNRAELSSIKNLDFINEVLHSIYRTTFDKDLSAPENECGLWTVKFKKL